MLKLLADNYSISAGLITVQDNTMLKLRECFTISLIGLITVQDNTMLKPGKEQKIEKDSLITVQDNTMLKQWLSTFATTYRFNYRSG